MKIENFHPVKQQAGLLSPSASMWILIASFGLALILCYFLAIPFLPAIVGSFTLAILFAPIDARLRGAGCANSVAATLTVIIAAIGFVVPAILVIGILLDETARSATQISALLDAESWKRYLESKPQFASIMRVANDRFDIPQLAKAGTSWLAGWSGSFVQGSFMGLISLILTFYFLFYLLRDRRLLIKSTENMLPLSALEFSILSERISNTVHATVFGRAVVAGVQGILGGLMFWWLDLPAPVFWGVLMGLLAVVPFLGAFVIWLPTAVFLALSGELQPAVILVVWGTVVVGLVDNVLYPALVGRRLMLHTLPSFVAITGGVVLLGTTGVVLGPLIVSVTAAMIAILRGRLAGRTTAVLSVRGGIK